MAKVTGIPSSLEALDEGLVADPPVVAEPVELETERARRVVDEVHEHVDTTAGDGHARHLAPGNQTDPELVGPLSGPGPDRPTSRGR